MGKCNSKDRFTSRVENYIRYRPRYPDEFSKFLNDIVCLRDSEIIADIGSGTGFSTLPFLNNGNKVYGIEPIKEMRGAAENSLSSYSNFNSVDGSAENSNLEKDSIDLIVSGQAFHWFDQKMAKIEFRRILNTKRSSNNLPNTILIWNSRQLDSTPFLKEYEKLLLGLASNYENIYHETRSKNRISELFNPNGYKIAEFENKQVFDYEQMRGRVLSSSYSPEPNDNNYSIFIEKLKDIFNKFEINGLVEFLYTTKVYFGIV